MAIVVRWGDCMPYEISAIFNQQRPFSDNVSLGALNLVALDIASANLPSEAQADR